MRQNLMSWRLLGLCGFLLAQAAFTAPPQAAAQLQITEILFNTVASPEPKWEWIEVRNDSGTDWDLDGYLFDDDDGPALELPNILAIGSGGMAQNTIVPAGGVAVLYNGTPLSFDDTRFRAAWQLPPAVPLIAVDTPPALNNSGDAIGLWTADNYLLDIGDPGMTGTLTVQQFTNASAAIDYDTANGFPGATNASIYWNGGGSYADGAQWLVSLAGIDGAGTSVETFTVGSVINSTQDVGNPGVVPAGPAPTGLLITEIMYNPRSPEDAADWEWVEVFNNTGAGLDFGAVPHLFDDDDGGPLAAPNITSGAIPDGESAILFNADQLTLANLQDAWGSNVNFVPVTHWSALSNAGDTIGIWNDFDLYLADEASGSFDNALAHVAYDDDPATGWPIDDGNGSIYLSPLTADPQDGLSWFLSAEGDGLSFFAMEAVDRQLDHPGGDVGSPGVFGSSPPTVDGDFNDDGLYDCLDIDSLVANIAAATQDLAFDLTGDGSVDGADLLAWLVEGGTATIGAPFLVGDATLDGFVDVSDFNLWNGSKFQTVAAWCHGDFNADGSVDVSDFNLWNGNKFQASSLAAVPEPAAGLLGLLGSWAALAAARRRCGERM